MTDHDKISQADQSLKEMLGDEPYYGVVSFLRAKISDTPMGADFCVMGIPYDLGTTGRPGARFGPRAVREQSLTLAEFEGELWPWDYKITDCYDVRDIGDISGFTAYPDRLSPLVEAAASKIIDAGARLLSIGGDHFISLPLLRAHAKKYGPLSLIHFDAHSDTWVDDDLNHGTMFYHGIKEGLINPETSIQIGMRTPNPDTHGIEIIDANELANLSPQQTADRIKHRVGHTCCYMTFDIDFLDPAYAPATGTPVVGGPTTQFARALLHKLQGLNIIGADQVEVAPHYETASQITALAGASVAMDMLYLMAAAATED